ncbi:MAG: class III extradiol ring-cleavage dioxygenase, partial [Tumebacillaceae bacterium]
TWTVLYHLFPQADIPVVQLSVNPLLTPAENYAIGKALSSLREQDVLIIGSGGTVHNLGRIYWGHTEPVEWAVKFEDWLAEMVKAWDLDALFDYLHRAPHARDAVPRNEHFIPLLYAMGAADDARQAKLLYSEFQFGSLSLRAWQFGS